MLRLLSSGSEPLADERNGNSRAASDAVTSDSESSGKDEELRSRSRALGERMSRRPTESPESRGEDSSKGSSSGIAYALRLSSEFVAAVAVGAGIGWGVDQAFGTSPWGMAGFLLIGFCAGVVNVLRAAERMASESQGSARQGRKEPPGGAGSVDSAEAERTDPVAARAPKPEESEPEESARRGRRD